MVAAAFSDPRRQWHQLMQAGTWLGAVAATFAAPPPADLTSSASLGVIAVSRFTIAVLIATLSVPLVRWKRKSDTHLWTLLNLIALGCSLISVFQYQHI